MNEKLLLILIAITNIATEIIWGLIPFEAKKNFGGNLKQLISVAIGIISTLIAYFTGFFGSQDIHSVIIEILLIVIGANQVYDKLIQPIRNIT